ncbi:hypothetical protein WG66_006063 [Moniliophthora roreri]|nr:hypothetical protein WG66_006063 [Moniliophthora roreri]
MFIFFGWKYNNLLSSNGTSISGSTARLLYTDRCWKAGCARCGASGWEFDVSGTMIEAIDIEKMQCLVVVTLDKILRLNVPHYATTSHPKAQESEGRGVRLSYEQLRSALLEIHGPCEWGNLNVLRVIMFEELESEYCEKRRRWSLDQLRNSKEDIDRIVAGIDNIPTVVVNPGHSRDDSRVTLSCITDELSSADGTVNEGHCSKSSS